MAALLDTSVAVLLLRRRLREEAAEAVRAARAEIEAGTALLPAAALTELLIGEGRPERFQALHSALARLPTAILPREAAGHAGAMGSFLRSGGAPIPFPDLLIAATAVWLDVRLLAWDADYARARKLAQGTRSAHEGAKLWRRLDLHPASLDA